MFKTIWSSNGDLDKYIEMSVEDKRRELSNWYDSEMVDQLSDDDLDAALADNIDIYDHAADDFEYNISPMIQDQVLGGFIIDEDFNIVLPDVLVSDMKGPSAELNEDESGDLIWDVEGRKSFKLIGFSNDQDEFIQQLDDLGILSTMHNLYPNQDDEDIEIYDIADLIPFDRDMLEQVLTHVKNTNNLGESAETLDEAKAKNAGKLAQEVEEIKDLADEYGKEYFTQMPFTSYDNDPISIEMQYPEFFRIVKAFFKEMEILSPEELNDPDELDVQWDQGIDQHDWDVLMRACDKLVQNKGVQFEKEYKTGYNSVLDDDEILANRKQEESLKEDFIEVTTYDQAKDLGSGTKWIWSGNYPGHEDEGEYYFNKYKNLGKMFIDPEKKLCKIVTANKTFIYDKDDKVLKESLNEAARFYVDGDSVVDSLNDNNSIGTMYDDGTIELFDAENVSKEDRDKIRKDLGDHYYVSFLDEDWINPELYKPFGHDSYDSGYVYEPRDPEEDEARILPPDADDEDWEDDLDEDRADSLQEDTATWPWGDPNSVIPEHNVEDDDHSEIDKYL